MRVRTVRRPPGQGGRQEAVEDSATNGSGRAVGSPRLGERINYRCPVCGDGGGDATYKPTRYGDNDWLVGCWSPECERDRRYLPKLGDAFGLGEAASKEQIVSALRLIGRAGRRREAKPLPSAATVEGWHARLAGSGHALGYLTQRRGIAPAVLRRERIGWDGDRLTFPMFDPAHKLVALKTRAPKAGVQMRAWPGEGRAWPLYPPVDRRRDWTMLVAGELDALAARSAGLPASSVTLGAGHWRDDWTADLAGLRVVVCFDNNEEQQARACRGAAIGRDRRPPAQSPRAGARSAEGRPERLEHVERVRGSARLERVILMTAKDVDAFARTLRGAELSPATRRKYEVVVSMILDHAVTRGYIETNPLTTRPKAKSKRARRPAIRVYSLDVVEQIADAAGGQTGALIRTAALTGLRQGELIALRWHDVSWTGQAITVRHTYVAGEGEDVPKSGSSRTVAMSDQAGAVLDALSKRELWTKGTDLVFPGDLGEHLDPSTLRRLYMKARDAVIAKASKDGDELDRLPFHSLRHCFGSRCAAAGVPLSTLQAWMGHANVSTTMQYVHHAPQAHDAARLTAAFAGPVEQVEQWSRRHERHAQDDQAQERRVPNPNYNPKAARGCTIFGRGRLRAPEARHHLSPHGRARHCCST